MRLEFEDFFASEYPRLLRSMRIMTRSRMEEDLAQEAMARVLQRWDRVCEMEDPRGYLYRVALNLNGLWLRRRRLRATKERSATAGSNLSYDTGEVELMAAIQALPARDREVIVLVAWLGLTAGEAANILKVQPGTIRVRLHRARGRLRESVGSQGTEAGDG